MFPLPAAKTDSTASTFESSLLPCPLIFASGDDHFANATHNATESAETEVAPVTATEPCDALILRIDSPAVMSGDQAQSTASSIAIHTIWVADPKHVICSVGHSVTGTSVNELVDGNDNKRDSGVERAASFVLLVCFVIFQE